MPFNQTLDNALVSDRNQYPQLPTSVYGNKKDQEDPLNIYATSKLMFDNFIKDTTGFNGEKDMTIVGLRLCNVYGPYECIKERRMSFLGRMLRNMILNKTIDLFEETGNKRDWVYVEDVCEAIFKSLQASKHGIYNIGSGSTISFIDLFEIINPIIAKINIGKVSIKMQMEIKVAL